MPVVSLPGYDPNTDQLEFDNGDFLFGSDTRMIRVTRHVRDGRLTAIFPFMVLYEPWPEEFLWRPILLLNAVPAWHSMYRSYRIPDMLENVYQTADQYQGVQTVTTDLIRDTEAWKQYGRYARNNFLWKYQEALDERAAEAASEVRSDL